MGLFCITIDLDEVRCYCEIHGLDDPELAGRRTVYERAVPRALRFLEELGVPATWFAVGRDLEENPPAAEVLREAARRGGEIANHTMNHRYDLTAQPDTAVKAEIAEGGEAIAKNVGVAPRGFRAPGYNVTRAVTAALAELGYAYDSSVLPCPVYFAARAAAIAAKAAMQRRSASLVGDPRMPLAPTKPYRIAENNPFAEGQGLVELPIAVVTPARLPFIGTAITAAGQVGAGLLAKQAAGLGFVNLELHGIDFADADTDDLRALARHQPDLRIPLAKKLAALERACKTLLDAGAQPMTLLDAAGRLFV
jgi:peptidoglycan-N-acetylglucosamine deacetylase